MKTLPQSDSGSGGHKQGQFRINSQPTVEAEILFKAVKNRDLTIIRRLTQGSKKALDWVDECGTPVLHFAVFVGWTDVLELLLEQGFDANKTDLVGRTAVHVAASEGLVNCLQILLRHGARLNEKDSHQRTPLHCAADAGQVSSILFLLEGSKAQGGEIVDVNAPGFDGMTPLHAAAENQQNGSIRILLALKANPNIRDNEGITPLMLCAKLGNTEGLELLLSNGADPDLVDNTGTTALMQVGVFSLLYPLVVQLSSFEILAPRLVSSPRTKSFKCC